MTNREEILMSKAMLSQFSGRCRIQVHLVEETMGEVTGEVMVGVMIDADVLCYCFYECYLV
jgi:hypothetical protein